MTDRKALLYRDAKALNERTKYRDMTDAELARWNGLLAEIRLINKEPKLRVARTGPQEPRRQVNPPQWGHVRARRDPWA